LAAALQKLVSDMFYNDRDKIRMVYYYFGCYPYDFATGCYFDMRTYIGVDGHMIVQYG
jgi:hypothetical protein